MKARLLIALFSALSSNAVAQNMLAPCGEGYPDRYRAGVNNIIDKAVGRPSSLQLTSYPSFYAESGLRLVGTELYFVTFHASFWAEAHPNFRDGRTRMDFSKPKIRTTTRHAPLSATLARRIESAYAKAIEKAVKNDLTGLDGVLYIFSTSDRACASAWSPEPRTGNGHLVGLMERLEIHATLAAPGELQQSEKAMELLLMAIALD